MSVQQITLRLEDEGGEMTVPMSFVNESGYLTQMTKDRDTADGSTDTIPLKMPQFGVLTSSVMKELLKIESLRRDSDMDSCLVCDAQSEHLYMLFERDFQCFKKLFMVTDFLEMYKITKVITSVFNTKIATFTNENQVRECLELPDDYSSMEKHQISALRMVFHEPDA